MIEWSDFVGQDGGGVKAYSGEIDHAARVLFMRHPSPVLYSIRFGAVDAGRCRGFEAIRQAVRYVDLRGTLRDISPHHRQEWGMNCILEYGVSN